MLRYSKKVSCNKKYYTSKIENFQTILHTFVLKYNFDDNKPLQYNNQHQLHSNSLLKYM